MRFWRGPSGLGQQEVGRSSGRAGWAIDTKQAFVAGLREQNKQGAIRQV